MLSEIWKLEGAPLAHIKPASEWTARLTGMPRCPHCQSHDVRLTSQTRLLQRQSYFCRACGAESGLVPIEASRR